MSRFLDLINGKPESSVPAPSPTPKVVLEKPKVVVEKPKVEKQTSTSPTVTVSDKE
jgi:hypothetical protein